MSKRLADEVATNNVVATYATTEVDTPFDGADDISFLIRTSHHNAHKRMHLIVQDDITTKVGQPVYDNTDTGNHASPTYIKPPQEDEKQLSRPQLSGFDTLHPTLNSGNLDGTQEKQRHLQLHQHQPGQSSEVNIQESKHLVKTVLDLPVFVTIEGCRVASYLMDGEPYLCLPQLLQFIQQEFLLDTVIDKFEELVTSFKSATPTQIQGFIKAIVLPQDATSCPLIKRSDAEWICLALHDQLDQQKWANIIDVCSKDELETASDNKSKSGGSSKQIILNENMQAKTSSMEKQREHSFRSTSTMSSMYSPENSDQTSAIQIIKSKLQRAPADDLAQSVQSVKIDCKSNLSAFCSNEPPKETATSLADRTNHNVRRKLFESEAQDTILKLARSVTSTLIIQVYHRCFGKCVGLYYPSLLRNSGSDCIECSSCHKMLSPRRFTGHTHGAKEVNVCHWGFNSYNWRNYIKLSRKQPMNNIDDDELLVQFNLLRSTQDEVTKPVTDFQDTYDRSTQKKLSKPVEDNLSVVKSKGSCSPKGGIQSHRRQINSVSNLSGERSALSRPIDEPAELSICSSHSSLETLDKSSYDARASDEFPFPWGLNQALVSSNCKTALPGVSMVEGNEKLKSHPAGPLYEPSTSTCNSSANMLRSDQLDKNMTHFFNQLYGDRANFTDFTAATTTGNAFSRLPTDRLLKQDLFVSSSLTNYLDSRGVHPKMTEEIVDNTLGYIQKARTLF